MTVEFIRENDFDSNNYTIITDDNKYSLPVNQKRTVINVEDTDKIEFYVKTRWIKTKKYRIDLKSKKSVVELKNILCSKSYRISIIFTFLVLFLLSLITYTPILWYLVCFYVVWALFLIGIYTIWSKYYIRVRIRYSD